MVTLADGPLLVRILDAFQNVLGNGGGGSSLALLNLAHVRREQRPPPLVPLARHCSKDSAKEICKLLVRIARGLATSGSSDCAKESCKLLI